MRKKKRRSMKRVIINVSIIYVIIMVIMTLEVGLSRMDMAEREMRSRVAQLDTVIRQVIYTDTTGGIPKLKGNAEQCIKDSITSADLNGLLDYFGVEAAIYDKDFTPIVATTSDWTVKYNDLSTFERKTAHFSGERYLSNDQLNTLIENHGTRYRMGKSQESRTVTVRGELDENGRFVPFSFDILDKRSGNLIESIQVGGHDKVATVVGELVDIGEVFLPSGAYFGRGQLRSDAQYCKVRGYVLNADNLRENAEAHRLGVKRPNGKYRYATTVYMGDKGERIYAVCAHYYNPFADCIRIIVLMGAAMAIACVLSMVVIRSRYGKMDEK